MKCEKCTTEFEGDFCPSCGFEVKKSQQQSHSKSKGVTIINILLCVFIGSMISFVLALINEGLHAIVTCGIFAFVIATIIYILFDNSKLKTLISIATFIISFCIYSIPYNYATGENESGLLFFIIAFGPYIVLTYIFSIK